MIMNPTIPVQSWRCEWCFSPFTRDRRSLAEVEALRKVLKVEMTTPFDPAICDSCFNHIMGITVPEEEVLGVKPPMTSMGFPNLLLANKMKAG